MSIENLFPMATTPFEQYMLADERDGYTMTFRVCVTLAGQLDRSRFESAVREIEDLQPLLQAVIQPLGDSQFQWQYAGPGNVTIDWLHDLDEVTPIDLTREAGIRVCIHESDQSTRLLLLVHHGCVDAIGASQFLAAVLEKYRQPSDSQATQLDNADLIHLLQQRGRLLPKPKNEESQETVTKLARETLRVIANPPSPLMSSRIVAERSNANGLSLRREEPLSSARANTEFGQLLTTTLEADVVGKLRVLAHSADATVNDILMRDLFCTLQQWNHERGAHHATRLRISVPINMRPALETELCANVLSYCFVTRKAEQCRHPQALLDSIRQETETIRNEQLGTHLLYALDLVRNIPGGMQLVLRNPCISTTVLSNLGDLNLICPQLESTGEAAVKSFSFVPPLRPGTRAVFSAVTFRGELALALTTDPKFFDDNETALLMSNFVGRIRHSIDATKPTA